MNKKIIILLILLLFFFLLFLKQDASNDNILYIPNFLDEKDSKTILKLRSDKDNFIFEDFRYSKPLTDRSVYNIFYSDKYMNQIQHNLNKELYPSKFPIEHRYYSEDSEGMQWHKDLLMYKKPQYEGIYTIRNLSTSATAQSYQSHAVGWNSNFSFYLILIYSLLLHFHLLECFFPDITWVKIQDYHIQ